MDQILGKVFHVVKQPAHPDAQQSNGYGQNQILTAAVGIQGESLIQRIGFRLHSQQSRYLACRIGRQEAGQQRRGKQGAHRGEFHAEQHGGQGRSEQSGEHGTHTRHHQDLAVGFLQMQQPGQQGSGGAA